MLYVLVFLLVFATDIRNYSYSSILFSHECHLNRFLCAMDDLSLNFGNIVALNMFASYKVMQTLHVVDNLFVGLLARLILICW